MKTGTVKFFNDARGFVTPINGSGDLYAHFSDIRADGFKILYEGQKFSFTRSMGQKSPAAAGIQPL